MSFTRKSATRLTPKSCARYTWLFSHPLEKLTVEKQASWERLTHPPELKRGLDVGQAFHRMSREREAYEFESWLHHGDTASFLRKSYPIGLTLVGNCSTILILHKRRSLTGVFSVQRGRFEERRRRGSNGKWWVTPIR